MLQIKPNPAEEQMLILKHFLWSLNLSKNVCKTTGTCGLDQVNRTTLKTSEFACSQANTHELKLSYTDTVHLLTGSLQHFRQMTQGVIILQLGFRLVNILIWCFGSRVKAKQRKVCSGECLSVRDPADNRTEPWYVTSRSAIVFSRHRPWKKLNLGKQGRKKKNPLPTNTFFSWHFGCRFSELWQIKSSHNMCSR